MLGYPDSRCEARQRPRECVLGSATGSGMPFAARYVHAPTAAGLIPLWILAAGVRSRFSFTRCLDAYRTGIWLTLKLLTLMAPETSASPCTCVALMRARLDQIVVGSRRPASLSTSGHSCWRRAGPPRTELKAVKKPPPPRHRSGHDRPAVAEAERLTRRESAGPSPPNWVLPGHAGPGRQRVLPRVRLNCLAPLCHPADLAQPDEGRRPPRAQQPES